MPLKIGRYEIHDQVGKGATSSVYLADDPFSGTKVAIKVAYQSAFRDPETGSKVRRMFLNEAALAGKLRHPHIVGVLDAGVDEEFHYIVMEYVPGGTLERHTGPDKLLPAQQSVEIAFKCCDALDYACRQGVIHRDIKPANILVAQDTDIKITDFGAAVWRNSEATQVTGVVGSPLYMSPEQIRGEAVTHQSDIYSLGVVLYQLLTGATPFSSDSDVALMHKILNEPPPSLSQKRPDLPVAVVSAVERALEKDRARRYPAWGEFARALSEAYAPLEQRAGDISDTRKFNALKSLAFFRGFSEAELWEFLYLSQWRHFDPGRELLTEGEAGRSFFIVAAGELKVAKGGRSLGVLKAGDCFGEMAYIQEKPAPRSATVSAASEVLLIKVKADALRGASDNLQLRINRQFLRVLSDRLAHTDHLLSKL